MASTKISELGAASALDGTEAVPIIQAGANKRTSVRTFLSRAVRTTAPTSPAVDDIWIDSSVNAISPVRVGADRWTSASIGGSPSLSFLNTGTAEGRWLCWAFDAATEEAVATMGVIFPPTWQSVHVDLIWSNPLTGVGDVDWRITHGEAADTEALGGRAVVVNTVTVAAPAQFVVKRTRLASGRAVVPAKLQTWQLRRMAAVVTDTLANDASMLAVEFTKAS